MTTTANAGAPRKQPRVKAPAKVPGSASTPSGADALVVPVGLLKKAFVADNGATAHFLLSMFLGGEQIPKGWDQAPGGWEAKPDKSWKRTPFPVPAPLGIVHVAAYNGGNPKAGRRWISECGVIVDTISTSAGFLAAVHFGSGKAWVKAAHMDAPFRWTMVEIDETIAPAVDDPARTGSTQEA